MNLTKKKTDETINTDNSEILEEILELVRNQQKLLFSPEDLIPPQYLRQVLQITNVKSRFDEEDVVKLENNIFKLKEVINKYQGDENTIK